MRQIVPDREIVELPDDDAIFMTGFAIRDGRGRVMVSINFDNDFVDSWQLEAPRYPQKFSHLGIRLGINYVIYAMTH